MGEVRESGVSMVDGMLERGGDCDFPLPDVATSVVAKWIIIISHNEGKKGMSKSF